jgi:hypothetical protein
MKDSYFLISKIKNARDEYIRRLNTIYQTNLEKVCNSNQIIRIASFQSGVEIVRGRAKFTEDGSVIVTSSDGKTQQCKA